MEVVGNVALLAGYIVAIVGSLLLAVQAFREHVLWGLACLFFPLASLAFAVLHWEEARVPFFVWALGVLLSVVGVILTGGTAVTVGA